MILMFLLCPLVPIKTPLELAKKKSLNVFLLFINLSIDDYVIPRNILFPVGPLLHLFNCMG